MASIRKQRHRWQLRYRDPTGVQRSETLGRYPLSAVRPVTILSWVADMEKAGVGRHAQRRAYSIVSQVFDQAVRLGMVNANPVPNGRDDVPHVPPSQPRFLTVEEVERLADTIDSHYRTWVLTVAFLGLRWGEAAGLRVRDFDRLHPTVHVVQQLNEVGGKFEFGPPKTKAGTRVIDVPEFLVPLLVEQAASKLPDTLMFTTEHGDPLRRSNFIRRHWAPAIERAKIEHCSPHALRHSYASWLAAAGVPAHELAAALGHAKPSTSLNLYSHVMPHRRRVGAELLDGMRAQMEPVASSAPG